MALIVPKSKLAANGDYNLSGERYRESGARTNTFPLVRLGDCEAFEIKSGGTPKSGVTEYWDDNVAWATLVDLPATDFITKITSTKRTITRKGRDESSTELLPKSSVIVSTRATIGRIAINRIPIATNHGFKSVVIRDSGVALPEYVALALTRLVPTMQSRATGAGRSLKSQRSNSANSKSPFRRLRCRRRSWRRSRAIRRKLRIANCELRNVERR